MPTHTQGKSSGPSAWHCAQGARPRCRRRRRTCLLMPSATIDQRPTHTAFFNLSIPSLSLSFSKFAFVSARRSLCILPQRSVLAVCLTVCAPPPLPFHVCMSFYLSSYPPVSLPPSFSFLPIHLNIHIPPISTKNAKMKTLPGTIKENEENYTS